MFINKGLKVISVKLKKYSNILCYFIYGLCLRFFIVMFYVFRIGL